LKKVISVVGARPNFMKVAPIYREFLKYKESITHLIVHTGQHYDEKMSKIFFDDLELPKPDIYLGVGSASHSVQTAKIMVEFEKIILDQKPDMVIVVGDVNSTIACSIVASKLLVPLVHVEAGLRSFDNTMPEEINRKVTDVLSDLLFITEKSGIANLKNEGINSNKVHLVGNVMIDSLIRYREKSKQSSLLKELGITEKHFILVTLHRPSNVDQKENLEKILSIFEGFNSNLPIVFPMHPRTQKNISVLGLKERFNNLKNVKIVDPVGYLDFINLMGNAKLILTDSGGIQEETTYLGIPCITMRDNTERPITVEVGSNYLIGLNVEEVIKTGNMILSGNIKNHRVPDLWDGKAAERIVKILVDYLNKP
jgi:UDP-N-acetylglucosamine 2-epimerase (non-hydrolysing)